jgi:hypothetical protein
MSNSMLSELSLDEIIQQCWSIQAAIKKLKKDRALYDAELSRRNRIVKPETTPSETISSETQEHPSQTQEPPSQMEPPSQTPSYVPPPRVRDAERNWPFMRCKNLVRILKIKNPSKNHHGLLEQLAHHHKMTVEELKKTSPKDLFQNQPALQYDLLHPRKSGYYWPYWAI